MSSNPPSTTPFAATSAEPTHILLVEDAADLAQVLGRELKAAGYRVTHAADGESALQLARNDPFQIVILDWLLPGLDGLEVLRRLRAHSAVPVLMLTARDAEIDRVLGLEMGADDYLTKPFSTRELIARVRAMLRRRVLIEATIAQDRDPAHEVIRIGPLHLEPEAHLAVVAGRALDLTRIEFEVLSLLTRHVGRVFSRAYLLDTVWKVDGVAGDRAVDNTILRLRRKLGGMGACIEAVWGVGYRWKGDGLG